MASFVPPSFSPSSFVPFYDDEGFLIHGEIIPSIIPKLREIRGEMDRRYNPGEPGATITVMWDDGHGKKGYATYSKGIANVSTGEERTEKTPQHFGSVSKQFTAACVVDLAEKGQLDLNADIHTYLPDLPRFTYRGEAVQVTVNHLLNMNSGLPEVLALEWLAGKEDQDLTMDAKLQFLYRLGGGDPPHIDLSYKPGTLPDHQMATHYCNTNYYLLEKIVKAASKPSEDLAEYARKHIFSRLGMKDIHFINPDLPVHHQSMPGYHVGERGEIREVTTRNTTHGACGIIGTPTDMALWFFTAPHTSLWAKLTQPCTDEKTESLTYARGLNVAERNGHLIEYHGGAIEGFHTEFIRCSRGEESFGVFFAENREMTPSHDEPIHFAAMNRIMGFEVIPKNSSEGPAEFHRSPLTREDMMSITGIYYSPILGADITIGLKEEEGLWGLTLTPMHSESMPCTFQPEAEGVFREMIPGQKEGSALLEMKEGTLYFSDQSAVIPRIALIRKPPDSSVAAPLDRFARSLAERAYFTGSVMVKKGKEVIYAHGYGSACPGVPNTTVTRFQIASLTKQFTAAAILQLCEKGLLRFDQPINTCLPLFLRSEKWDGITIQHLLSHTSGIPDYLDFEQKGSLEENLQEARKRDLTFPPGTQQSYSNTGYLLLGQIIEEVSRMSYAKYLRENIFGPAGMYRSGVREDHDSTVAGLAEGYLLQGDHVEIDLSEDIAAAFSDGAVYSTVEDLAKWSEALSREGTLLSPDSKRKMTQEGYCGLCIDDFFGKKRIYHPGSIAGYNADFSYFPQDDLCVVVLANNADISAPFMASQIARSILDPGYPLPHLVEFPADFPYEQYEKTFHSERSFPDQFSFFRKEGKFFVIHRRGERAEISECLLLANHHLVTPKEGLAFFWQEGKLLVQGDNGSIIDEQVPE